MEFRWEMIGLNYNRKRQKQVILTPQRSSHILILRSHGEDLEQSQFKLHLIQYMCWLLVQYM